MNGDLKVLEEKTAELENLPHPVIVTEAAKEAANLVKDTAEKAAADLLTLASQTATQLEVWQNWATQTLGEIREHVKAIKEHVEQIEKKIETEPRSESR
jgi:gas vesicle protein